MDSAELWERRTTLEDADGTVFELLGIEDLIRAKKTQRDKDWPMIRRLGRCSLRRVSVRTERGSSSILAAGIAHPKF